MPGLPARGKYGHLYWNKSFSFAVFLFTSISFYLPWKRRKSSLEKKSFSAFHSALFKGLRVLWEQRSDQIFISRILIFEAVRSWSFISGMRQQTFCFQFLGQHIYIYYENIFEIWIKIFISYCLCKINDLGTQQINSSISNDIRSPGPRPAWLSWVVLITCYSSLICWAAPRRRQPFHRCRCWNA